MPSLQIDTNKLYNTLVDVFEITPDELQEYEDSIRECIHEKKIKCYDATGATIQDEKIGEYEHLMFDKSVMLINLLFETIELSDTDPKIEDLKQDPWFFRNFVYKAALGNAFKKYNVSPNGVQGVVKIILDFYGVSDQYDLSTPEGITEAYITTYLNYLTATQQYTKEEIAEEYPKFETMVMSDSRMLTLDGVKRFCGYTGFAFLIKYCNSDLASLVDAQPSILNSVH